MNILLKLQRLLFYIIKLPCPVTDPVHKIYHKQLVYPFENNWRNEVSIMLKMYDTTKIPSTLRKDCWKAYVKKQVTITLKS